jgi:hypothetical protein
MTTTNIDERYENAIRMLHHYYDGENECFEVSSSALKESSLSVDPLSEFTKAICPRLVREGILKESPFVTDNIFNGRFVNEAKFSRLCREMEGSTTDVAVKMMNEINSLERMIPFVVDGRTLGNAYKALRAKNENITLAQQHPSKKSLESLDLVAKMNPSKVIFLVLDKHFEVPIRCKVENAHGTETYIKKLHNIAYSFGNAPGKRVPYDKNLADSINNKLFRISKVNKYLKTNGLETPTLVQKSHDNTLVLKNEVVVKTVLIKDVPQPYQSLYIDKTQ